jgi:hypothetical protein
MKAPIVSPAVKSNSNRLLPLFWTPIPDRAARTVRSCGSMCLGVMIQRRRFWIWREALASGRKPFHARQLLSKKDGSGLLKIKIPPDSGNRAAQDGSMAKAFQRLNEQVNPEADADAAIATMADRPVLIHVPVNTGATGREALRRAMPCNAAEDITP